jgi:hypothetical protein
MNHFRDRRFIAAMSTYVVLALLAIFTLEGKIRLATLILLAGIALKTCLEVLKRHLD